VLRSSVFFPALECGKVFAHQRDGLLESIAFAIFVAELFVELCTVADHLLHRTCRGEGAALVTIDAVFPARASVGFSAEIARRLHRHAAALAEFSLIQSAAGAGPALGIRRLGRAAFGAEFAGGRSAAFAFPCAGLYGLRFLGTALRAELTRGGCAAGTFPAARCRGCRCRRSLLLRLLLLLLS
jgi:hypothetical protein